MNTTAICMLTSTAWCCRPFHTLLQLHAEIEKANNHRQAMQDGLRQLLKQSDMCAASASAMTTSLTDAERGLQQVGVHAKSFRAFV